MFCLKGGRLFKKDGHVLKKDGHLFPAPKIHTDLHSYLLEIKRNAANEEVEDGLFYILNSCFLKEKCFSL